MALRSKTISLFTFVIGGLYLYQLLNLESPPMRSAGKDAVRLPPSTVVKNEVSELKATNGALLQKLADSKADNQRLKSTEVTDVDSNKRGEAITRILHQTYKSSKLPANLEAWRRSCMRLNPGWKIKLWTDEDNRELVQTHYPELLDLYDNYDINIKRVDMVRYLYLHKFGGVYFDMDTVCIRSFENLFDSSDFMVAKQYKTISAEQEHEKYANAFMASPPKHKILGQILKELPMKGEAGLHVLEATGPIFLTSILMNTRYQWTELPFELVYAQEWISPPFCKSIKDCTRKYPDAVAVSMWTHSWQESGEIIDREWHSD